MTPVGGNISRQFFDVWMQRDCFFFEGASFDVFVVHDFKDGVLLKKISLKIYEKHSQKYNKYKYVSMTQYDCGFAPSKFMGSTYT